MKWSIKNENCISCNSTYYKHKGKGLCTKCYSVYNEIKKLDNASESELNNFLKYISSSNKNKTKTAYINTKKEEIKNIIISKKLKYLIQYGQIESNKIKVDIVKIEMILNEISRRAGRRDNLYTNRLLKFDTHFNNEQRKIIALNLLKMLI